jgi:FkbM family methyltransferase
MGILMSKPPFQMMLESSLEKWRADTFWVKEPETLYWIQSFKEKEIFYDVGANIGLFSLYCASLHKTMAIYAFEPSKINYKRLFINAVMNHYTNIIPLCCALSNDRKMNMYWHEGIDPVEGTTGGFLSDKGEDTEKIDVTSIDNMVINGLGIPNHIKIDVDGGEQEILEGMLVTLNKSSVKSILMEIDLIKSNKPLIVEIMRQKGFVTNNEFNQLEHHSRYRRAREGIDVENVVFTR